MSGFGKPFREFTINNVQNNQCPLPSMVPEIKDYQTCKVMMDQCASSAETRALQRNNPSYYQYANWFSGFGKNDKSVTSHDQNGDGEMTFFGGCEILLLKDNESRSRLWNSASDRLGEQLFRYHSNRNSAYQNPHPTVTCKFNNNIDTNCW